MELTLDQALQKGIEAHKAGNVQEADRYYSAILKANPKHPDANHNMGVLAVGVSKFDEALPYFKIALEANPSAAQFWLSYIDALIKLDRIADAKALFDQAKSKGAKGDGFDQIEKKLVETEVNAAPGKLQEPHQEQLQSLINLYTQGQSHEALIQASQLLKQFTNSVVLHNIVGATNQSLGNLDEAIEAYKKAISIKPDYADAYNNKGIVLKEQGKLDEAIEAYTKALSIKPDYAEAHNNLGMVLKNQADLEGAIKAYKKALSINPENANFHNNMGIALKEEGKLEEGIDAFSKAISIKPDYADAYNNMGVAFKDHGNPERAIEAYKKALAIKPDFAAAQINLDAISSESVPRWHIPMMNEDLRNSAYQEAINSAIQKRDVVLDIGTGAGLLSMIAADSGAKEVITCEMSQPIANIAAKIIRKNGFASKIKLINKNSKNLILGQDVDKKVDLLVSEILSSEFVGEGIQTSILDAKKRLLKKNGKMIPQAGSIMIALIENTGKLAKELFVDNALGYDIQDFNTITAKKWLISLEDEPVLLSEPIEAFTFNFCNFKNVYSDQKRITLKANNTGTCAGVIQWLKVNLYSEIEYENNPVEMYRSGSVSGWKTPIYRFPEPVNILKGEPLNIQANLSEDNCWFALKK